MPAKKPELPLVGAHVSTAGGLEKGPERAHTIGCNCVQVFSDSPRLWQRRVISDLTIKNFGIESRIYDIYVNVIHSLYLVNLASDKPDLIEKSINSLIYDLTLSSKLESVGVVVHIGSHSQRGWDTCKEQVVQNVAHILEKTPSDSVFLIENAAGQGGKIGSALAEIRYMLDELKAPTRVGWCLDTCHAFAAGLRLTKHEGDRYIFDEIEQYNLQSDLKVIHVNDSRDEFFSHRDRHANLGDGFIGTEELKAFVNHPMLRRLPFILEVPGIEGTGPDAENINRLKNLFV